MKIEEAKLSIFNFIETSNNSVIEENERERFLQIDLQIHANKNRQASIWSTAKQDKGRVVVFFQPVLSAKAVFDSLGRFNERVMYYSVCLHFFQHRHPRHFLYMEHALEGFQ